LEKKGIYIQKIISFDGDSLPWVYICYIPSFLLSNGAEFSVKIPFDERIDENIIYGH